MSEALKNLGVPMPVYVTRKSADGYTGTLSMSIWMPILAMILVWLNIVVWSLIGLYEAAQVVF